jgi:phosphoglycerate dehydrogenase-like enzyme
MNILIASSIDPDAIEKLRSRHDVICAFNASPEVLKSHLRDRQALIFRSGVQINAEVLACAPDLKLIVRAGSGLDNIDLDYIRQHEIKMTRIPGPGAQAVAEMAFALMLALARRLFEAEHLWRQGRWAKYELQGFLLSGKVLGIVGCGNIGSRVGQLGAAWGMHPVGCIENPSAKESARLREKGIQPQALREVLSQADFVSIHVPLQNSTRNLINAEALALMKPGAFLVNLARGGVVDEKALYHALTTGRLRGAALDVHEKEGEGIISPFAELPNTILTPHIGAMTIDSQREIGRIVVQMIDSFEL